MNGLFVVPGEPVAKDRPRINRKTGTVYTPRETVEYENLVAMVCRRQPSFERREVSVRMWFRCGKRPRQKVKDIDNLIKAALDGMVKGGIIYDDCQVVHIDATRTQADTGEEGLTVWVQDFEDYALKTS